MIDLRSDTLTMPGKEMLECMFTAKVGDSGRLNEDGRGGDPSVKELEDLAANLTGKERALFLPSGTMGNHVALMTYCRPGDYVLVDTIQHIYRSEKAAFDLRFGQMKPLCYHLTKEGYPNVEEIRGLLKGKVVNSEDSDFVCPALLCVENTHNGAGGTCIPLSVLEELRDLAVHAGIPIHMDGARVFNAAAATGMDVKTICGYADSVMFCISKGLGAPAGSLLCGTEAFIREAAGTQKLLGGAMRQAGVLAAAGKYALEYQRRDLLEDHRRTKMVLENLRGLKKLYVPKEIQTNILILGTADTGMSAARIVEELKKMGLWLSVSGEENVRMVLYRDISDAQAMEAARIIREFDEQPEELEFHR